MDGRETLLRSPTSNAERPITKGIPLKSRWQTEVEHYLHGLKPDIRERYWALLQDRLSQGDEFDDILRSPTKDPLVVIFPESWTMRISAPEDGIVEWSTFDSIENFADYLRRSNTQPGLFQIVETDRETADSHDDHEDVMRSLFFAVTLKPENLDDDAEQTSNGHLRQPFYYTIRLLVVLERHGDHYTIQRMILLCDSGAATKDLKSYLSLANYSPFNDCPTNLKRSVRHFIVAELCKTLDDIQFKLQVMQYEGRKDPSYAKLDRVEHVKDVLEMTRRFLSYTENSIPEVLDLVAIDDHDRWPEDFERDREYLFASITKLEKKTESVQAAVRESQKEGFVEELCSYVLTRRA
ncbi:MAG: hypothetical protein Q9219_005600 [cf. Caloplaca sp. 3 TL-2023]